MEPRKTIAVDVDGTLLLKGGGRNEAVIAWLRTQHARGYKLFLWSARGEDHARAAAEFCGVTSLFCAILEKPGYILDDHGWNWVRFTGIIRSLVTPLP